MRYMFLKVLAIYLASHSVVFAESSSQTATEMKSECDSRAGWRMATTGVGHPSQCKDSPHYLFIMNEWISLYTSIKYN